MNHPDANRAADVKVRQLKVAAEFGLRIPKTLVTNDLGQARAFAARYGPVVYKPLTYVRYVTEDDALTVWTRPVRADEIDEEIAGTAHLFQSLVDKVADLRITVVGEQIFCVRFGLTEDGDPVFFECNPNGQWGWLEDETGAPITAAFADLLQRGTGT